MAVTKTEFQVNSGNTGWTAQHILDALETALGPTGAGLHSGTATTGVIRKILKPTDGWDQIGGQVAIATQNTPDRTWNSDFSDTGTHYDEWDYTDPTPPSGGTACVITVRRYGSSMTSSIHGKVACVLVRNGGSGYQDGDALTIPDSAIGGGGALGGVDIVLGTHSATQAEMRTLATQGGTSNWWWKDTDPHINHGTYGAGCKTAVLKVTNDASKTYGTTYYGLTVWDPFIYGSSSMPATLNLKSAVGFDPFVQCHTWYPLNDYQGGFTGTPGMDGYGVDPVQTSGGGSVPATGNTIAEISGSDEIAMCRFPHVCYRDLNGNGRSSSDARTYGYSLPFRISRSSTPTDYPLKIVTYKADASQDNSYCIIQFQQVVAGDVETLWSWSFNAGTQWGQNIWDLDNVFQGGVTIYRDTNRAKGGIIQMEGGEGTDTAIAIATQDCIDDNQYSYTGILPNHASSSHINVGTRMRESLYGYDKINPSSHSNRYNFREDRYATNFQGWDYEGTGDGYDTNQINMYHRNDSFDKIILNGVTHKVDVAANFHKPIKGLPVNSGFFPCPYYLPDDFVMIQLAVTPGATVVKSGDTITVSGSEVYTVIEASGETNDELYDNEDEVVSRWICFCARTT
tara:strand:+ start:1168 stop:3045 length:1878 start_codon:yes stop_codon:yes gene_type:complete